MDPVLLVLCHPNPKSFNHSVASAVASALVESGHTVLFHDLYQEGFDPVLSEGELRRRFSFDDLVQQHYRDLESAEALVVVHPEWWSGPPAMLKGWIDRVLRPGIGYEFEGEEFMPKTKVPLLTGKRALVLATTDAESPEDTGSASIGPADDTSSADGASPVKPSGTPRSREPVLAMLWRETFRYCGIEDYRFRMLYRVRDLDPADRREWILTSAEFARSLFA